MFRRNKARQHAVLARDIVQYFMETEQHPGLASVSFALHTDILTIMAPRSRRSSFSAPALTPETFEPLLSKLAEEPEAFAPADLAASFDHLFNADSSTETQVGAFLALLRGLCYLLGSSAS